MTVPVYNITSPLLEPFEFEKLVDSNNRIRWIKSNWHHSLYWSIIYVIVIFSMKHYMKNRPAFNLRIPLIIWNLGLSLWSICGTIRMIPGFLHVINEFGFTFSVCNNQYARTIQPTVFWGWLFVVSKVVELGDTLFIVLRKRKLIFLHWYHHVMTLIVCWYTISHLVAVTHWFCIMNYSVHSLMYPYYMLSAMQVKLPRKVAMLITSVQLSQMIIGSFICYWAISIKYSAQSCDFPDNALIIALLIYLSYVFLFARLFYFSYIKVASIKTKPKKNN